MSKYLVYGIERWDNSYYEIGRYDTIEEARIKVKNVQQSCYENQDVGLRDSIGIKILNENDKEKYREIYTRDWRERSKQDGPTKIK